MRMKQLIFVLILLIIILSIFTKEETKAKYVIEKNITVAMINV